MAGSPSPEKDKPPAAASISNADSLPQNGAADGHAASGTQASEQEKEIDDFGLPVKRISRRSISPVEDEYTSADEEPKASGEDPEIRLDHKARPDADIIPTSDQKTPARSESEPHPPTQLAGIGHADQDPTTEANDSSKEETRDRAVEPAVVDDILHGHTGAVSGWSHQALAPHRADVSGPEKEEDWQDMPAFAPYNLYDDEGKLVACEAREDDEEANAYAGLGGAGKGYTRVQVDEDAQSATSMDDNTNYLFKPKGTDLADDEEEQRDPLAQLQATKNLLTEGQRIAYVGVTRLAMAEMVKQLDDIERTKNTKKGTGISLESMKMWSQQMMVRIYMHMEIDSSEQVMIEQLAEHGVEPKDLTPALMQNARVKNPMAEENSKESQELKESRDPREPREGEALSSPKINDEKRAPAVSQSLAESTEGDETEQLPAYKEHEDGPLPEVQSPAQLGISKNIDIDLRWTILCDLFLVLLADSIYDARSRVLLERVAAALDVSWLEICRFEKRVTDSLEMQEAAKKETWDEADHLEHRRKRALKRRYMMMGLATVGGGLVIGLSGGLLAPVIGAGLAAGFTTIGVAGTSGFFGGTAATAIIASGAVITGSTVGVKAANRRTGAVKTFEYRPLHNNKRVNLIVTVSGWMIGKIDDVRLPYSTIDPVMGDMYSVLWEPEMLRSMGDTINILATEALTQGLQQVLGSTILIALMASLQLPIVLSKLSYLIDNPWTVSMARANAAGLILADSLIDRNLGARPITLVGFSLGSRVIFACLRELANKGAFGLIQNVYLFGSPIIANKDEYLRARTVVSGRFVNSYASNDWILGYLFRATGGGIRRVAGLAPVEGIQGLENIDVTKLVNGHMAYRAAIPRLMREVGWQVESDTFTEIEDPDPENHEKRQRELIRELDDARRQAENKPEKKRFGFFKKGKLAEKKKWETYDDSIRQGGDDFSTSAAEDNGNVLFDIEAIKAELKSEQIEVKQLESTLPPMKVQLNGSGTSIDKAPPSPYPKLRGTKSYDSTTRPKSEGSPKENPFNKGYDEYNLSEEALPHPPNAKHSTLSFDHGGFPSPSPGHLSPAHTNLSFDHNSPSPRDSPAFPPPRRTTSSSPGPPVSPPKDVSPAPQRPPLKTSTTMPQPESRDVGLGLEHNAWADEEDQDFGKERDVPLTFG